MSFESDLADAILSKFPVDFVTKRNAVIEGFKAEAKVGRDEYPFVQVFSVGIEADAADFGQEGRLYSVNAFALLEEAEMETMWTYIESLRQALFADYHLGGTVGRIWISQYAVEERDDVSRERTLAGFVFNAEVFV